MASLMTIGVSSLAAAQGSLGTIAHNIANVNTPGYSRQTAVLSTTVGNFTGGGFFGSGVDLTTVLRQYDQFLTQSVRINASQAASDAARAGALSELDSIFADANMGIGASYDSLLAAAGDLANRPGDTVARQAFISRADQLAQRLSSVGSQLTELGRLADSRFAQTAVQANSRLSEIKALNSQIAQSQATGHAPNDLLDQRDAALKSLNSLLSVTSVGAADGTVSLFTTSGTALLVGSQQAVLKTAPDPTDASRLALQVNLGPISQWLDSNAIAGGSMAGLLRFRDQDLASAINQVGRLAVVVADRFNTQQSLGVDATGTSGAALFSVAAATVRPHADNTGTGAVSVALADSSALRASDYRVGWDGSAFAVTRMADGQQTSAAGMPITMDGLTFTASGTMVAGNSYLVQPFAAASTGLAARPIAALQVATGYAATVEAAAANTGANVVRKFQVVRQTADSTLAVTIAFNNPPTTFNVTGLVGGNLSNVPYVQGQRVPAAPADYNGWSVVMDGTPAAGDSYSVRPTVGPSSDNRNALAFGALAELRVVDGATINQSYAALVGDVGVRVQSARDASSVSSRLEAESATRQQNLSGVNLDEEAANLLRYQQAYQASAKIIQTSQALFDSLMSAVGR